MNKKSEFYTTLKGIAILLVIIGHATALNMFNTIENYPYNNLAVEATKVFDNIQAFIYGFHMPLFMAITGGIFAISFSNNSINSLKFITKKIKRLVIPYLVIGIFLLIPIRFIVGYYENVNVFKVVLNDIILSFDCNFLWFILADFEITIICYFLWKKIKDKNIKTHLVVESIFLILSVIFVSKLKDLPFQISRTMQYLPWFFLGVLIQNYFVNIKEKLFDKKELKIFIISLILYIITFFVYQYLLNIVNNNTSNHMMIIKTIKMAIYYMMAFIGTLMSYAICFLIKSKFVNFFGNKSFYFYVTHSLLMLIYCKIIYLVIKPENMNNIIYCIAIVGNILFLTLFSYLIIIIGGEIKKMVKERKCYNGK